LSQTQKPATGNPTRIIDRIQTPDLLGIKNKKGSQDSREVEGYSMMTMPSPSPQRMDESPLMTWGRVDSTPMILSRPATYQIPQNSLRDDIANNLSLKIAQRKKQSQMAQKEKIKEMLTPTPIRKATDKRVQTPSLSTHSKSIRKEAVSTRGEKSQISNVALKNLQPDKGLTRNLLDI